ncbi:MAG: CRISPR-associated protein Cas4 [Acidimicrobiia bacterium]|nr:CRISPR-associated protein Cas4 [Acidimicrobiia bacterium]
MEQNDFGDVEPIAISAIEHYVYCARQCGLIHVDGTWSDNRHTVAGERGHRRADTFAARRERGVQVVRAVPLWSERLGLSGRADAVEYHTDGSLVPVEYKIGVRHGDAAHLQLAAQAMCLEDMHGRSVTRGALWFARPRRRLDVAIDEELRGLAIAVTEQIRVLIEDGVLPGAVDDPRCGECQFLGFCLPEVVRDSQRAQRYMDQVVFGCAS